MGSVGWMLPPLWSCENPKCFSLRRVLVSHVSSCSIAGTSSSPWAALMMLGCTSAPERASVSFEACYSDKKAILSSVGRGGAANCSSSSMMAETKDWEPNFVPAITTLLWGDRLGLSAPMSDSLLISLG